MRGSALRGYKFSSTYWNTSFWMSKELAPSLSTPFIFITEHIRNLINDVEKKENKAFKEAYHDLVKKGHYEFAFASTYLAHKGYISEYKIAPYYYYTVWNDEYNANVNISEYVFYALHKRVPLCNISKFKNIIDHDQIFWKILTRQKKHKNCQ